VVILSLKVSNSLLCAVWCVVLCCVGLDWIGFPCLHFSSLFFFYHFLSSFTSFLSTVTSFLSTSFFILFSHTYKHYKLSQSILLVTSHHIMSYHIISGTSAIRLLTHVILGFPLKSQEINSEINSANNELKSETAYYEHAENVFMLLSDLKM
jgi:hypothetical protein